MECDIKFLNALINILSRHFLLLDLFDSLALLLLVNRGQALNESKVKLLHFLIQIYADQISDGIKLVESMFRVASKLISSWIEGLIGPTSLLLLVPAPLVDLGLRQLSNSVKFFNCFFCPTWIFQEVFVKDLYLIRGLPLPFSSTLSLLLLFPVRFPTRR